MLDLKDLLAVQSVTYDTGEMEQFIIDYISEIGLDYTQDGEGNIYIIQKKGLPFVVAHMDTVHRINKGSLVPVQIGDLITGIMYPSMEQSGIGGDDKCGIYAALTLLTEGLCNAAFFVDEESGCLGSYKADKAMFKGCPYILQADRRGNNDFVTNISGEISSKEFQKAVRPHLKSHGYKLSTGMMTDVMALADIGIGISVANMSAGYYNPHMDDEYINIKDLDNCIDLMRAILTNIKQKFPHKRTKTYDSWGYYKPEGSSKNYGRYDATSRSWKFEPGNKLKPATGYDIHFQETTDPKKMCFTLDWEWIGDDVHENYIK